MTRRLWLWLPVAAVVVALAVVTLVVVRNADGGPHTAGQESTSPARPTCRHDLLANFDTDDEMTAAAARLREEPEVASITAHTKAENYEKFKEVFADDPELVANTPPEALPASVEMKPVDDADPNALRDRIHEKYSAEVEVLPCPEAPK